MTVEKCVERIEELWGHGIENEEIGKIITEEFTEDVLTDGEILRRVGWGNLPKYFRVKKVEG